MPARNATLILEGAVEGKDFEPYSIDIEIPIRYIPSTLEPISGEIILGVEIRGSDAERTYDLILKASEPLFQIDGEGQLNIVRVKIRWDDEPGLAASYVIRKQKTETSIDQNTMGTKWKFLLVKVPTDPPQYELIHAESSGSSYDDRVNTIMNSEPCKSKPQSKACKNQLKVNT